MKMTGIFFRGLLCICISSMVCLANAVKYQLPMQAIDPKVWFINAGAAWQFPQSNSSMTIPNGSDFPLPYNVGFVS